MKSKLQYHEGIVFGKPVNKSHLLAHTAISFIIVTLFGDSRFLCKMLPVGELDSKFIFEQTNLIFNAIKNAGGNNVAIICDGNLRKPRIL